MKKILIPIILTLALLAGAVGCTRGETRFPANLNERFADFGRIDVDAEGSDTNVAAYSIMVFSSSNSVREGKHLQQTYILFMSEFAFQATEAPDLGERGIIATVKFTDRAGYFVVFDHNTIKLHREQSDALVSLNIPAKMIPLDLPNPWERPEPERQKPGQQQM